MFGTRIFAIELVAHENAQQGEQNQRMRQGEGEIIDHGKSFRRSA